MLFFDIAALEIVHVLHVPVVMAHAHRQQYDLYRWTNFEFRANLGLELIWDRANLSQRPIWLVLLFSRLILLG